MTSQKQILANKENSKKSTGPKDTRKTKKNAVKFGLFSKEMIVKNAYFKENMKEFVLLQQSLYEEYSPKTPTEEILVEKIFDCCWRLKRLRRAETAVVSKRMYELPIKLIEDLKHWDSFNFLQKSDKKDLSILEHFSTEMLEDFIKRIKRQIPQINKGDKEAMKDFMGDYNEEEVDSMDDEKLKDVSLDQAERMLTLYEVLFELKGKKLKHFAQIGQSLALVLPENEMTNFTAYEKTLLNHMLTTIAFLRRLKGWD